MLLRPRRQIVARGRVVDRRRGRRGCCRFGGQGAHYAAESNAGHHTIPTSERGANHGAGASADHRAADRALGRLRRVKVRKGRIVGAGR